MIKFQFNKLVRDKIVSSLESEGIKCIYSPLTTQEHINHLKLKLSEEVNEVLEAQNEEELYEEIGDVMDVLDALVKKANISTQKLELIRKKKNEKNGKFDSGTYIQYCAVPKSNEAKISFFRNQSTKYPEIT